MYIDIDLSDPPERIIQLCEADDFTEFKVLVRSGSPDVGDLAEALAGVGEVTRDGHVVVEGEVVRKLAGPNATSPEWEVGFGRMIDYARDRGWLVNESGIRAHCEFVNP